MNEFPKISIVTPSFNQGQYIEETILSVLNQNYPNLEYIIIDGGSTDNTVDIIKKYEDKLTYWVSEKDKGQSHAINKGLMHCTGEIFNWLNSDDYLNPRALHEIAKKYMEEKKYIVAAKSRIFSSTNEWISSTPIGSDFYMFSKARIDQPATYWNLTIFKEFGKINEDQYLTMDAEHWFKFLLKYDSTNISTLDFIVVNFREHTNSKTVQNRKEIILGRISLYKQIMMAQKGIQNVFSTYTEYLNKDRKHEIIRGIKDFKNYWLKYFILHLDFATALKILRNK